MTQAVNDPLPDTENFKCHSCQILRPMEQLTTCPECKAMICGIGKCTATCKCDDLPSPEYLLENENFKEKFCLHGPGKTCEGCFFNTLRQVMFLEDTQGRYLHVSHSFLDCFGIQPGSLINRTAQECFPYEVAIELEEGDRLALKTGKTDTRIIWWRHASGRKMLWMVKKYRIRKDIIMGVAFDMTEYILACKSDNRAAMDEPHTRLIESSLGCHAA